jgi:cell division transport system permease protein
MKAMTRRGFSYSFNEGILTIFQNKLISLLSIGTIAISFTVMGLFLLIGVNIASLTSSYGESLQIHAFLEDDISDSQKEELITWLEKDRRIESKNYFDKDDALEKFADLFPEEEVMLKGMEENYLPASYEIMVRQGDSKDPEEVAELVDDISDLPGVEQVIYDRQWVDTLESAGDWILYTGFVLGGLLILAAIVTTSNIIKMNVLSRSGEIEIMRLVGAEGIFIKGPFVFGGILQGFLASVLACIALFFIFELGIVVLQEAEIGFISDFQYQFLPISYISLFLLGGIIVGTLASLLSFGKASKI